VPKSKNTKFQKEALNMISDLTKKEKNALKEAVTVLYLNDRSDYINGLWDVVRAIIGEKVDDEDFNLKTLLHALDPEMGR
jgi:hypothetical protein